MTESDFTQATDAVLGVLEFKVPVTYNYCAAVRDELRKHLPDVALDVFHRGNVKTLELVIEARLPGKYYARIIPLV